MKFQVHTTESAPDASRATLDSTVKKYGFLPNLFGVLAESPTAVQAYAAINKALEQSALSPVEQQVVTLTVWRLAADTIELTGDLSALGRVKAAGDASSPLGEGIADVLNIGGL